MAEVLPKVSVVTVVLNNRAFVSDAIESVLAQTYPNIEHIVKDGGSSDGTLEVIARYGDKVRLISEKDKNLYEGLNQGLRAATGDILATLNADDMYASPDAIARMIARMEAEKAEAAWADLVYVDRKDASRIVRRWKSSSFSPANFRWGWMPPHPTFFARREAYERYGYFRADMRISADYELILRFLGKHGIKGAYLPETIIKMRTGGVSGGFLARTRDIRREDYRAWRVNGMRGGLLASLMKPLRKIPQLF